MELEKFIRIIPDFPKKGIIFKDITPLLSSPEGMAKCLKGLLEMVGEESIDKVVGVESRGFFFGTLLATKLNAGFVPVRKPGKLPFTTLKQPYELEYGWDALEIHTDAVKKGERVLIHDDVLATGGTAKAVCELVEKSGGVIVQCNFIMQLDFLNGKNRLAPYPIKSLLHY